MRNNKKMFRKYLLVFFYDKSDKKWRLFEMKLIRQMKMRVSLKNEEKKIILQFFTNYFLI